MSHRCLGGYRSEAQSIAIAVVHPVEASTYGLDLVANIVREYAYRRESRDRAADCTPDFVAALQVYVHIALYPLEAV